MMLTFYKKFPLGILTPTHRPETGCPFCRKGKFCMEHDYWTIFDMVVALHSDWGHWNSEVRRLTMEVDRLRSEIQRYEQELAAAIRDKSDLEHRYKQLLDKFESLLDTLQRQAVEQDRLQRLERHDRYQNRKPKRLTVALIAGTRRAVGGI